MAEEKGYGSGKPLSVTESRNRRRKAAGLAIRPEPGKMPDKRTRPAPLTPRTPGKVRPDMGYGPGKTPRTPGKVKPGFTNPKLPGLPKPPNPPKPNITRPTTPKPVPPKARGGR